MDYVNYYEVLGIKEDASPVEITAAYRKKAGEYHPDKVSHLGQDIKDLAHDRMKKINEAKEWLFEPQKKAQYDNYLPTIKEKLEEKKVEWETSDNSQELLMKNVVENRDENLQCFELEIGKSVKNIYNYFGKDNKKYQETYNQALSNLKNKGTEFGMSERFVEDTFKSRRLEYFERMSLIQQKMSLTEQKNEANARIKKEIEHSKRVEAENQMLEKKVAEKTQNLNHLDLEIGKKVEYLYNIFYMNPKEFKDIRETEASNLLEMGKVLEIDEKTVKGRFNGAWKNYNEMKKREEEKEKESWEREMNAEMKKEEAVLKRKEAEKMAEKERKERKETEKEAERERERNERAAQIAEEKIRKSAISEGANIYAHDIVFKKYDKEGKKERWSDLLMEIEKKGVYVDDKTEEQLNELIKEKEKEFKKDKRKEQGLIAKFQYGTIKEKILIGFGITGAALGSGTGIGIVLGYFL